MLECIKSEIDCLNKRLSISVSTENELLLNISNYATFSEGKRLRPSLVFLFTKMLNREIEENHYNLAQALELIHTASLIHDDVIDESDTRHNKQSVQSKWDKQTAVIAGDFLLAKALKLLGKTENVKIINLFAEVLEEICNGEIQQFGQIGGNPSLEEVIEKSKRKTAMLYFAGIKGAMILSNATDKQTKAAENFALNFGTAYQITDDLLPYISEYSEKSKHTDFEKHIFTLPLLFAAEENPEIFEITDPKEFHDAIKATCAIERTIHEANKYITGAIDSLSCFEDNLFKQKLTDLANYIIERRF